jgi:hypothetical protein
MDTLPRRPILVISPNLQTRALLAAQVGETTGHRVVPAPGVDAALDLLGIAPLKPVLMIVDTGPRTRPEEIDALIEALPKTPVILVVSALRRAALAPLIERCAAYLTRPVRIGEIGDSAAAVLRASATTQARPEPEARP